MIDLYVHVCICIYISMFVCLFYAVNLIRVYKSINPESNVIFSTYEYIWEGNISRIKIRENEL